MISNFTRTPFGEPFTERMNGVLYPGVCAPMYQSLANWPGDSNTMWVNFESWKADGPKVLATIWNELGWAFPPEATQAALVRSEAHKNRPESYQIVPPEKIR